MSAGPAWVRSARRLLGRALRRTPLRGQDRTRLLVLLGGVEPARVRRLAGARAAEAWTVRRSDELATRAVRKEHDTCVVGARSLADLRRALPMLVRCGRASRIVMVVDRTDRPEQVTVPSVLTSNRLTHAEIAVHGRGGDGVVVDCRMRRPTSVQSVVRGIVAGPGRAGADLAAVGLRLGLTSPAALEWAAGDPWARLVDERALSVAADDIAPVDAVVGAEVRTTPPAATDPPLFPVVAAGPGPHPMTWRWDDTASGSRAAALAAADPTSLLPPVDLRVVSPRGFDNAVGDRTAAVRQRAGGDGGLEVGTGGGHVVVTLDARGTLSENDVAALRPLRHVTFDRSGAVGPVQMAGLLAQLLVAGVPVVTGPLPEQVRLLLPAALAEHVESLDDAVSADPLRRESWSVSARRAALQAFSAPAYWRAAAARLQRAVTPPPGVSVLLATKRPGNVGFALAQLSRQTWGEVEVVLALHGCPADHPAVQEAVARYTRPIHVVEVGADVVFGDVLNTALARSSGRFVAKMDDDDWYGPDHVTDLVLTHTYSGAVLVGCADHFTYLQAGDTTVRDTAHGTERWASRVSGGTLLVARDDLDRLGRWRPVRRAVDRCLIQSVGASGGHIYAMHDLGFCLYRGSDDHTWDPGDEHFVSRRPQSWPGFVDPGQLGGLVSR